MHCDNEITDVEEEDHFVRDDVDNSVPPTNYLIEPVGAFISKESQYYQIGLAQPSTNDYLMSIDTSPLHPTDEEEIVFAPVENQIHSAATPDDAGLEEFWIMLMESVIP